MPKNNVINLESGVESITLVGLIKKAARLKGLVYWDGCERACSKPIATYALDNETLAFLAKHGVKQNPRPDGIFTLSDTTERPEPRGDTVETAFWNFRRRKDRKDEKIDELEIALSVGFGITMEKRGIILLPQAYGTFLSPGYNGAHRHMFKLLVEYHQDAPAVAQEIAASDDTFVVGFTELGLGGIRRLSDLFEEFARGNHTIKQLANHQEVFNPMPYPYYQNPGDELFIIEPAQPKVIGVWRAQLTEYRSNLVA